MMSSFQRFLSARPNAFGTCEVEVTSDTSSVLDLVSDESRVTPTSMDSSSASTFSEESNLDFGFESVEQRQAWQLGIPLLTAYSMSGTPLPESIRPNRAMEVALVRVFLVSFFSTASS